MSNSNEWEYVGKKGKHGGKKTGKQKVAGLTNGKFQEAENDAASGGIKESDTIFKVFLEEEKRKEAKLKARQAPQTQGDKVSNAKKASTKENTSKSKKKKSTSSVKEDADSPQSPGIALRKISLKELQEVTETVKTHFPDTPSIWLKDLASFMNQKLVVEIDDPVFSQHPINYPSSLVPQDISKHIIQLFNECTIPTLQLFQDHCFQTIVNNMIRNQQPTFGYRIMLQFLGNYKPEITVNNLTQLLQLQKSYQNRHAVCLSVLWGAFQAGTTDLKVGMNVWLKLMLPLIGVKAYSKYALESLEQLLRIHKITRDDVIGVREYFSIFDLVFAHGGTQSAQQQLKLLHPQLRAIAFGRNAVNVKNFFPSFLLRLSPDASESLKQELLENLETCLIKDSNCLTIWKQLYSQHVVQSKILLKHLQDNWDRLRHQFPTKVFQETLEYFQTCNRTGTTNVVNNDADDCSKQCEDLLFKMNRSGTSWFRMFAFICIITVAFLAYDCHIHGSFEKSATATYLNEWGVLPYLDKTTYKARKYTREIVLDLKKRAPIYYDKVRKVCGPYFKVIYEQLTKAYDYLWELSKPLRTYLEKNIPILISKVKKDYLPQVLSVAQAIITRVRELAVLVFVALTDFFVQIWEWLIENVLIGSWSPENIREVMLNGFEATQFYFGQAFQWISEQIKAFVA